jgi:hypothetical protein
MMLLVPVILPGLFDPEFAAFEYDLMMLFIRLADRQVLLGADILSESQVRTRLFLRLADRHSL